MTEDPSRTTLAGTEATSSETRPDPTLAQLITWAESRAALEFKRREAVKSASKAVVDVLRISAAKTTR